MDRKGRKKVGPSLNTKDQSKRTLKKACKTGKSRPEGKKITGKGDGGTRPKAQIGHSKQKKRGGKIQGGYGRETGREDKVLTYKKASLRKKRCLRSVRTELGWGGNIQAP